MSHVLLLLYEEVVKHPNVTHNLGVDHYLLGEGHGQFGKKRLNGMWPKNV